MPLVKGNEPPKLPYLTRHFSLAELIITNTGLDNWPTDQERPRLRELAAHLEKVRFECDNRPIIIHSAFRSEAVNRRVGGVPNSAHRLGWAADISCPTLPINRLAERCCNVGGFDQVIFEPQRGIVHLSIDPRQRGERLTLVDGQYLNGILHFWHRYRKR